MPETIQNNRPDYYQIERVSNSFLSDFKRKLLGLESKKNSEAMRFGSGLHQFVLEPHLFNFREYTGRDRMTFMEMNRSLRSAVDPELLKGEYEKEYLYEFEGFKCKLKADIVGADHVTDLKTTSAQDEVSFMKQAIEFDYIRQGAWYLDCPEISGSGIDLFRIIGISKVKPHTVFVWELHRHSNFIETGREEYKFLLEELRGYSEYATKFTAVKEFYQL